MKKSDFGIFSYQDRKSKTYHDRKKNNKNSGNFCPIAIGFALPILIGKKNDKIFGNFFAYHDRKKNCFW